MATSVLKKITPANLGAVAKTGDTMTGDLITDSDIILTDGYLQGTENDGINHAIKLGHSGDNVMEFNEYGGLYNFYRNASNPRELIFQINGSQGPSNAPLPVTSGGTWATTAAGARANLGVNDIGTSQAQSAINLTTDGQIYSITITKDCWVCASFHIIASTDGTAMLWRNNIPVIKNEHTNGACNYWANAQFPCKAGGLLQYQLNTNASDSNIYFLTV